MTSKAEKKRRRKAAKVTLPGCESKPQHRAGAKPAEDPRKTALQARCRVSGRVDTPEAMDAARAPLWGCDVGRCIAEAAPRDQIGRAWETWCKITSARRNWLQRAIGTTGDPANSNMPMLSEAMETDASATVDTRTSEERDRDAKRAHLFWSDLIDGLPWLVQRAHLRAAVQNMGGPWWQEGKPTQKGRHLVRALLAVADMAEGKAAAKG